MYHAGTIAQYDRTSNTWGLVSFPELPVNFNWIMGVGSKAYLSFAACDMYEWSPASPTVLTRIDATMPSPVVVDPQIRGGNSQFGFAGDTYNLEREFFQFYASEKRWVQKAPFIGDQRYWPINFSIGNKFYSGLGAKTSNDVLVHDIYEYTPE